MKIRYVRNINASHMLIEGQTSLSDWEQRMIEQNMLEGILFAKSVSENGVVSLWYNITGKQALDVVLESTKLNYELLCEILTSIYSAVDELIKFLLQVNDLYLSPESIFFDYKTGKVWYCYFPGNKGMLPEAFAKLMEYLLTKVDHKDEKAVSLMYHMYEQTRKDGYGFWSLQKDIKISFPVEETEDNIQEIIHTSVEGGQKVPENNAEADMPMYENGVSAETSLGWDKKNNLVEKCRKIFKVCIDEKQKQKERYSLLEKLRKKILKRPHSKNEVTVEPFVFESETENIKSLHPTVLLSEISGKIEGILKYEGENGQKDMIIRTFPFLIGSDSSCEGYLHSETVSRRHARITKQDDIYFIEDLNSSNGTYVGGQLLNYRVRMSLHKDEIIMFADEKFRFS